MWTYQCGLISAIKNMFQMFSNAIIILNVIMKIDTTRHDTRHTTSDTRHMTRDTQHDMTRDTRHATHDTWHTTHDTRHRTHNTRHTTQDTRHRTHNTTHDTTRRHGMTWHDMTWSTSWSRRLVDMVDWTSWSAWSTWWSCLIRDSLKYLKSWPTTWAGRCN